MAHTVMVTGADGFIGSHLTEELVKRGEKVRAFCLYNSFGSLGWIDTLPPEIRSEIDIFMGDVRDPNGVRTAMRGQERVFHLAALIAIPFSYHSPDSYVDTNIKGTLNVLNAARELDTQRVLVTSTSEVYGMCQDPQFDEDNSKLVTGPIRMQRWIYSTSKQLLDRVIWAYGDKNGLKFTLFRPFNWMGPRLDNLNAARIGSSRAITQLILNLVEGSPIKLIEGGKQKRCFTDISDGIEALFRIIENKDGRCDGQIINIGNPDNEASIKELAEMLLACFERHPLRDRFPPFAGFREVESSDYYGKGYQDVEHRKPSIRNAKRCLNWEPKVEMEETVEHTLDFFLRTVELVDDKNP